MASASASTTIPAPVQKQRELVPIDRFVTMDAPDGTIFVMNVFIKSTMLDDFIKLVIPVVRKMREYHECLFCEVSVDPTDKGHVRIVHGWDKASASTFFRDNVEMQPWFGDYIKSLVHMRDPSRPRIIEHFDRIPIE